MKRISLSWILIILMTTPALAQYEEKDFQVKPIIGLWFGPVAPVPGTELSPILNAALGGGAFFRLNIPSDIFQMETGASIYQMQSLYTAQLTFLPIYGALVFKLPVEFPISFFFKGGAGSGFLQNKPEGNSGFLPIFYGGFESSFPAGKVVNVGVRFDYYFVYETWMKPEKNYKLINGHFISIGVMVNFNTNP